MKKSIIDELDEIKHLVIQYGEDRIVPDVDPIAEHKKTIGEKEMVWWAVLSAHDNIMAENKYKKLKKQIEEDIDTYAILSHKGEYHNAKIVDIKKFKEFGFPDKKNLLPDYYTDDHDAKVWLKFSSIEKADESTLNKFYKRSFQLKEFLERPGQKHPIMYIKKKD